MKNRKAASLKRDTLQLSSAEWEAECRQCGLCCFEKHSDSKGRYRLTRVACRYLDVVTRECRVYHKRFATGEECLKLTPAVIREADWLPETCSYRILLTTHPDIQLIE